MVQVLAVEEDPAAFAPILGQKKELRQSASLPAPANRRTAPDRRIIAVFTGGRKESRMHNSSTRAVRHGT
jgi:hypothetical protein